LQTLNANITRARWRRLEHKTGARATSLDPLGEEGGGDEKSLK
jgi:hypothetical protein